MRPRGKYARRARRKFRRRVYRRSRRYARKAFSKAVRRVLRKTTETKSTIANVAENNKVLYHNGVNVLTTNLFATSQGTSHEQRIGDRIFAKAFALKMYFENQQYRDNVQYLVLIIRNKNMSGQDIVIGEDIWEGVSTTKCLDWIDTNKYDVMFAKRVWVKHDSTPGTANIMGTGGLDGQTGLNPDSVEYIGQGKRLVKFYIPIRKLMKYNDGSTRPSTMSYSLCVVPYISYTAQTGGTVYPAGHVSWVGKFYFKDDN